MTIFTPNNHAEKYYGDDKNRKLNGLIIEYARCFHFTKNMPFYGEVGVNYQAGFYSKEEEFAIGHKQYTMFNKIQNMTISLPINVGYRIQLTNNANLQPYVGIDMKFNIRLRSKTTFDKYYFTDMKILGIKDSDAAYQWKNHLSDDKESGMGSSNQVWNDFQLGWHIGVAFNWGSTRLGIRYGTDFIPAYKYKKDRINSSALTAAIGFYF